MNKKGSATITIVRIFFIASKLACLHSPSIFYRFPVTQISIDSHRLIDLEVFPKILFHGNAVYTPRYWYWSFRRFPRINPYHIVKNVRTPTKNGTPIVLLRNQNMEVKNWVLFGTHIWRQLTKRKTLFFYRDLYLETNISFNSDTVNFAF